MENPNTPEPVETQTEDTTPNTLKEDSATQTWGPLVGIIIIVAIIVLGGLYFWGQKLVTGGDNKAESISEEDPKREALESQSSSDDVSSIEADIEDTDFSDIDQELGTIESEFNF